MKNKKEGFTFRVGLFLLLVTFCLGTVQAQSSKITGYVKDQSGEPLIGVNVMEKGTTNGTVKRCVLDRKSTRLNSSHAT